MYRARDFPSLDPFSFPFHIHPPPFTQEDEAGYDDDFFDNDDEVIYEDGGEGVAVDAEALESGRNWPRPPVPPINTAADAVCKLSPKT